VPFVFTGLLIFLATILKIYPCVAVVSVFNRKRFLICISLLIICYLASQVAELQKIRNSTPVSHTLAYGVASIVEALNSRLPFRLNTGLVASGLLIFAISTGAIRKVSILTHHRIDCLTEFRMFMVGSSIFISTFLLGSNFDYRLIFLILCIPFIEKILNRLIKIPLLLSIVLASNQLVIQKILGVTVGGMCCHLSKCVVFIMLIWIVKNNVATLASLINQPKLNQLT
jgi:hypothetical protein